MRQFLGAPPKLCFGLLRLNKCNSPKHSFGYLVNDTLVFAKDNMLYFGLFLGSAALSLISMFLFKNRKSQFMLGRLNIILNFFLLGLFVYQSLNVSGETNVSEKGIGIFLPIISIVLLVLANKAIKKDEDLVKSVDRLR